MIEDSNKNRLYCFKVSVFHQDEKNFLERKKASQEPNVSILEEICELKKMVIDIDQKHTNALTELTNAFVKHQKETNEKLDGYKLDVDRKFQKITCDISKIRSDISKIKNDNEEDPEMLAKDEDEENEII